MAASDSAVVAKQVAINGSSSRMRADSFCQDPFFRCSFNNSAISAALRFDRSSLGNRAILAEIRRKTKAQGLAAWPEEFLGDDGMLDFWKHLRSHIEGRAEMDALEVAIEAAAAVFDHFIAHAQAAHSPCALTV